MSKIRYLLIQLRTKLWIKPALTGFAAVLWVQLALVANRYLPYDALFNVEQDMLLSLLKILASTMLTVAIFAVSAMVAAFGLVATTATPRATRLVMQDSSTQNTLAAFLSAFIYAIVALVAVSAIPYGKFGRMTLFIGYVLIVVWVLVSFVRWVDKISKLGRVHDTIRRVEDACRRAIENPAVAGTYGAREATGDDPDGMRILSKEIGYLQYIDMEEIQEFAKAAGTRVRLLARPGSFMDRTRPLAIVADKRELGDKEMKKLHEAFTVGEQRHVESDPRCGLLMLAEIADRALSPGINDPGTAIDAIGSQVRLLSIWVDATRETPESEYDLVEISPLHAGDLMEDGFTAISRDGAGMFEVGVRLQKAFRSLIDLGHPGLTAAARLHSRLALEQALEKLPTSFHRERLKQLAEKTQAEATGGQG